MPKVKFFVTATSPGAHEKESQKTADKINAWLTENEGNIDVTEIHQSSGGNEVMVVTTVSIWYIDYSDQKIDLSEIEQSITILG